MNSFRPSIILISLSLRLFEMSVHASIPQEQQDPNMAVGDFKQHLYSQLKAAGVMSSLKVCKDELAAC